jgi:hypothetical protein
VTENIHPEPIDGRPAGGSSARAGTRPRRRAGSGNVRRPYALSHGLLSDEPVVIPGAESSARYKKVRRKILCDLHLVGAVEFWLGEQIVHTLWRLRRVSLYETAVLSREMDRVDKELAVEISKAAAKDKREVQILNPWPWFKMGHDSLKGSLELLKRLPKMPPEASVKAQRALDLLLFLALMAKVPFEEVVLPGVPDDPLRSAHPWSVGNVKDAICAIALEAACDPEALETLGQIKAKNLLTEHDMETKPLRAQRQERRHLHFLPQGPAQDGIVRYEAHLMRVLSKYQNQLEIAQAQRRGEATPLARLDIQGLPDA